jgi:hypothetical protein
MGRLADHVGFRAGWLAGFGLCLVAFGTNPVFSHAEMAARASGPAFEVTSALGRRLYALPDDESVTAARKKLAADPKNVALVLALSKAEAGRRQYKEAVHVPRGCWLHPGMPISTLNGAIAN